MVKTEHEEGKSMKTLDQYRFLARGLAQNWREKNHLCDVIIQVHDVSFYGSRFVLGSASPVFKHMFLSDTENRYKTIPLADVSLEGFQVIWDFIYEERYGTDDEFIALAVLKDSHRLQIDLLYEEYAEKLKKMLKLENAFTVLSTAQNLHAKSLLEEAVRFIALKFQEFILTSDFLSMSLETLQMFLERDDLEVSSEIDIYEAVQRWLDHDPPRRGDLPKLLNRIRLPLLSLRYLRRHITRDPMILEDSQCLDLVVEAKHFHIPQLRDMVPAEKTKARGTGLYHPFWCVGRDEDGAKLFSLNPRDWSAHALTSYPWPDTMSFVEAFLAVDRSLFLIGCGEMNVLDVERKEWENGPPPPEDLQWPASAFGLNSIFVSGGFSSTDPTRKSKSVKRLELGSWRWLQAPQMTYERYAASAVIQDSSLHVLGGNSRTHERLDTRTNNWSELSPWPGDWLCPGVVVHEGQIHVAGGGFWDDPVISDVYVYDERKNDWRLLSPMQEKRFRHGLIHFEGDLYAVGGAKTPSIEMYDGTEWKIVASLDLNACERVCIMEWTTG